jgi:hypothetical protein
MLTIIDKLLHEEWFLYYVSQFLPFESCQSLSCTLKDIHISDYGWKKLCYRDFPKVNFASLQLDKPFEIYCICQNIGDYCVICKRELWNDNYVGEHYLLMCNCLKIPFYCYSHKSCTDILPSYNNYLPNVSNQQCKNRLVNFRCSFCHHKKQGLPIYVYS